MVQKKADSRSSEGTDLHSNLRPSMRPVAARASSRFLNNHLLTYSEDKTEIDNYCDATQVIEPDTPTEQQLALLCLDYLRSLRRSRPSQNDLLTEAGLHEDYVTLAIWALSKSFARPSDLEHGSIKDAERTLENPQQFGNDPYFHPSYKHIVNAQTNLKNKLFKIADNLIIPSLETMESEILYTVPPDTPRSAESQGRPSTGGSSGFGFQHSPNSSLNMHRFLWYEYDDDHYSNQFRFYDSMGLSSNPPLSLQQITESGIKALKAKSRMQAEDNMMSESLFSNFLDAVSKQGFFDITEKEILGHPAARVGMDDENIMEIRDKIHEERFRKVVSKFRSKLAANYEQEEEKEEEELEGERFASSSFKPIQNEDEVEEGKLGDDLSVQRYQDDADKDDDDETLVAASVFGDTLSNMNENGGGIDMEDDCSKYSRSSRQSRISVGSSTERRDMETAERLKGYGNVAMQKKKYEKAKNYYTKALELLPAGPTSHVYFSNRAAALLSMRNFNEAVWDAERSIALKPDYAKAHARLGLAHFLLERYEDAVNAYTQAVRFDPDNAMSLSYLEKSKKKLAVSAKELAAAEEYMNSAQKKITKEPSHRGREIKSRNHVSTRTMPEQRNARPKSDPGHGKVRSFSQSRIDDVKRSRPHPASTRRPSTEGSHRANRSRSLSTNPERRTALDPSIVYKPGEDPPEEREVSPPKAMPVPPKTHTLSSSTLQGRMDKAKKASPQRHSSIRFVESEEDIRVKNNDPPVYTPSSDSILRDTTDQDEADRLKGEGNKAMARKQYEKAVKYYSKSLRLAPAGRNSHVYFSNRAAALCYLERYEEAELDAERSLALNPEYGKAHARLGLSRYFLRDYYGAIEAYESALIYDPDNAASKSYLAKARAKIHNRRLSSRRIDVE